MSVMRFHISGNKVTSCRIIEFRIFAFQKSGLSTSVSRSETALLKLNIILKKKKKEKLIKDEVKHA